VVKDSAARRGQGGRGGGGRRRSMLLKTNFGGEELMEKVVFINRSSKVVKGGRRFNFFRARRCRRQKRPRRLRAWQGERSRGRHQRGGETRAQPDGSRLFERRDDSARSLLPLRRRENLLRPASPGNGIIAGKNRPCCLGSAGNKRHLSKSLGSSNAANVVKATLKVC